MVFIFSDSKVDWSADTTGAQKLPTRRSSSGQEAPHTTAAQGRACREEENTERSLSVLRTSTPLKPKPNRKRTLLVAGTQQALRVRITCHHHLMPAQCAIVCTNAMVVVCFCFKIGDLVPGDDPGAERAERRAGGRDPVGGLGYTLLPRASEMMCGWWAVSAALTCLRLEDSCADILASFLLPCTACCSVSSCPLLCGFL